MNSDVITIVRDPRHVLGKHFKINADGGIDKEAAVSVSFGYAEMRHVPDLHHLQALLKEVSEDPHAAIINSGFHGVAIREKFVILSEKEFEKRLKLFGREAQQGVQSVTIDGLDYKALGRFKENVYPSSYQILDRDVDAHTPPEFASLDDEQWVAKIDLLLPDFSSCDRLRAHSTSGRVLRDGIPVGAGNGHTWIKIKDPSDVDRVRVALTVKAAELGLTWAKPKYSKAHPGEIVARSITTILDPSVWTPGRLVFVGKPVVGEGLSVVQQVFEFSPGILDYAIDTATLDLPTPERIREITKRAGVEMSLSGEGRTLGFAVNDLTLDMKLETKDHGTVSIAEALWLMKNKEKLRCQSPFRESSSFAAVLFKRSEGNHCLYDSGTSTTHWMDCAQDFDALPPFTPNEEEQQAGIRDRNTDRLSSSQGANAGALALGPANPASIDSDPVASLKKNLIELSTNENPFDILPHYVDMWIPQDEVTLLAGHGGGGKSYVALSIAVHVALGLSFGPLATTQTAVLFFSGEDGAKVLRQRLARICRTLNIDPQQLEGKLYLLDASDIDPALHREQRVNIDGRQLIVTQTPLLDALASLVQQLDVGLVVVDNASDTYDDDEIKRVRVRAFVRSLRSRIARPGRAVLLLAHINKASANAGSGAGTEDYSGSTAWHNSVRSRLSLTTEKDKSFKIEHAKANLGMKAGPVKLEWHEGVPLVAGSYSGAEAGAAIARASEKARDDEDKLALVDLIQDFDKRGEPVTSSFQGPATVFKLIKTHPGFPKNTGSDRLTALLRQLETEGRIYRRTIKTVQRKTKEVFTCAVIVPKSAPILNTGTVPTAEEQEAACAN